MHIITGVPAHLRLAVPGLAVDLQLRVPAALGAQLRAATAVHTEVVGVAPLPLAQHASQCRAGSAPVSVVGRFTHSRKVLSPSLLLGSSAIVAPGNALVPRLAIPSWRDVVEARLMCRGRCTPRATPLRSTEGAGDGHLLRRCFGWGRCTSKRIRRGRYTRWVRNQLHHEPFRNIHHSAACAVASATGHLVRGRHGRSTVQGRVLPGRSTHSAATALRRCNPAGRALTRCTPTAT